jgi:hypothetical protein
MLSTFFNAKPVVDETTRDWIFDNFAWCIAQLDGDYFKKNSELVLPNNTFYPGSVSSVEEMAETVFANTIKYSGMTSWPIKLVSATDFKQKPMPQLLFESTLRGENCKLINKEPVPAIEIAFHPSQLNQPQDLIAYLVQIQANILLSQNGMLVSIDKEMLAQTIDLVACFMGFGVIFANTAYQFKGGCGSCNNRNLNRQPALPELETVYALALFTVIKGGDIKEVKKELKSHLYKQFRQAHKEIVLYLQQTTNPEHSLLTTNLSN